MIITGVVSIIPHIVTILLLAITVILGVFLVHKKLLKYFTNEATQGTIVKIYKIVIGVITASAAMTILYVVLFLSNPFERSHIETNKSAIFDSTHKPKTLLEINKTNKGVIKRKHIEKETEAEADNTKALNQSRELFK